MTRLTLLFAILFCSRLFGQSTFTVDPSTTYQTMIGFGGFGVNSDANYTKYLIDYLGITVLRVGVETESATKEYVTLANIADGSVPFYDMSASALTFFSTIKAKNIKVIATCWSPPSVLKKNKCIQQTVNGVCGVQCPTYNCADDNNYLLPEYYDEYARFLALWTKNFQSKTGINLYAISIQNEPLFNEPYASAKLFSYNYGPMLKAAHDTFAAHSDLSAIKFFGPEHMCTYPGNSGGQGAGSKYIQEVIDDPAYKPYLDAFAVHGYSDGMTPDLGSSNEWNSFYNKIVVENNKMLWMSETSGEGSDWAGGYGYMKSMFMALKAGKVNLWTYWAMSAMYSSGSPTRKLYNHMHFYRFIRPGAQMIKVTDSDPDVEAIAFKNGSDFTVIAINLSKVKKTIKFNEFAGKPSFFQWYRSSEMDMCSYVGKVTDNTFELDGETVNTITYTASDPDVTYGPKPTSSLTSTMVTDNSITVNWSAVPGWNLNTTPINTTGYIVYINGVKKTPDGPTTKTSWTFTNLKPGTNYTIEIFTRDAMLNQSIAAKLVVPTTCSMGGCVGIDDASENNLSIIPNPATNVIRVSCDEEVLEIVSIIDISGKIIYQKEKVSRNELISVENMPQGVYIVKAKGKDKTMTSKFIKE